MVYGASLVAMIELMKKKEFTFIGVNEINNNAFFLNNDEIEKYPLQLPNFDNIEKYSRHLKKESKNIFGFLNYKKYSDCLIECSGCKILDLDTNKLITISDLKF